ncbi:MAG TPA: hypothetical protein VJ844_07680 [Mucilaginibacter sp.]|nr:hypothetical protein [Mucilaginibacter sp.]
MLITVLEVAALLAVIIVPLSGPGKKKKATEVKIDTDVTHAHYAVNEDGDLVKIDREELSSHTH